MSKLLNSHSLNLRVKSKYFSDTMCQDIEDIKKISESLFIWYSSRTLTIVESKLSFTKKILNAIVCCFLPNFNQYPFYPPCIWHKFIVQGVPTLSGHPVTCNWLQNNMCYHRNYENHDLFDCAYYDFCVCIFLIHIQFFWLICFSQFFIY